MNDWISKRGNITKQSINTLIKIKIVIFYIDGNTKNIKDRKEIEIWKMVPWKRN